MLLGDRISRAPEFFDVPVAGGSLRAARWGRGPRLVLGIHGLTGSSVQLAPVAERLGLEWTLVAPDLRGRGASNSLPPPYGLAAHAADCAALLDYLLTSPGAAPGTPPDGALQAPHGASPTGFAGGPVVVLGESLGGYIAVALAASRPDLVERVVLADGGLPLPVPEGVTADDLLRLVVGPAVERLDVVYATQDDYFVFWRQHPAVSEEWNTHVERYLEYDLESAEGGFRSRARKEPVRQDAVDLLPGSGILGDSLGSISCPASLVRAERDLLNRPQPIYPDGVVAEWRSRLPHLTDEMVADTNHYTLMFGERGSAALARSVVAVEAP